MAQTFNTNTPAPGLLTEKKQAKMREARESRTAEEESDYLLLSLHHGTHTPKLMKCSQLMALVANKQRALLAPLPSPDARLLQNRLNRLDEFWQSAN